jgi:hypothetical protein
MVAGGSKSAANLRLYESALLRRVQLGRGRGGTMPP